MKAPAMKKQKTIKVKTENGIDIIKMTANRCTRNANLMGYNVNVNGIKFFCSVLTMDEAFESAYIRYIKKYR